MAIQPPFAQAILNGSKRIEFRKRRLASDIDTVLIYESAPTKRIVGHFTVARTELATPRRLWKEFGSVGSIGRADYLSYYGDSPQAVGLVIGRVERYRTPIALADLSQQPTVPQSFSYLPAAALAEIRSLQDSELAWLDRIPGLGTLPARNLVALRSRCPSALSMVASQR